ncbi:MAG: recombination protein RecR [Spirochaetales bacterium]|nr:recombination protein RecR [Spirochaetales bacterium]
MNTLDLLVKNLTKLPGIGSKSARRVAHFLLKADGSWVHELASQIGNLQKNVKKCEHCGNYTDKSPCPICSDPGRDRSVICVVEQPEDINTIEATGDFKGLYHVLTGVISPIDGMGPEELTIGMLIHRLKGGTVKELIIATNPTVEGETTALYLVNLLKKSGLKISQLASGLPAGGDLEYADRLTISRSLKGRRTLLKAEEGLRSIGILNKEKPLF